MQFQMLVSSVNTIFAQVSVPIFSEIHGYNDRERFSRVFSTYFRFNWNLAVIFGLIAMACSPWLIQIFGNNFADGNSILLLTICSNVITVATSIMGQFFYSTGLMWIGLMLNLLWGASLLVAAYNLVLHGAAGLATSLLFAYLFLLFVQIYIINKLYINHLKTMIKLQLINYALLSFGFFLIISDLCNILKLILLSLVIFFLLACFAIDIIKIFKYLPCPGFMKQLLRPLRDISISKPGYWK